MDTDDLLAAARGDRTSDLVFTGGRVVNVLTGDIEAVDVAVAGGVVVGLGPGYEGHDVVELGGRWLLPGFIDAHVHIESSLVTPPEFARTVVPRGTTTVVSDPHEIANVHGRDGVRYMLEASEGLPLSVLVMASSCVPATHMATGGAALGVDDLRDLAEHPRVIGLAEVMNFPGVVSGDPAVLDKIAAFRRPVGGAPVDGHAPGVRGRALNAYVLGGPGSDHECTTADEAAEKLRRGLFVFLRQASNARNLVDLLPAVTPDTRHRVALCTDDRQPPDLLDEGGIDAMIRTVVAEGMEPIDAIRLATSNPAGYFGLHDRGVIAPGRRADLVVCSDLERVDVDEVWSGGRLAARAGRPLPWPVDRVAPPPPSMRVDVSETSLRIPARDGSVRVIVAVEDQIVTRTAEETPTVRAGEVVADPERDLVKLAVVERHTGSGRVGLGLVRGLGLRRGAIAGTVAHDHHNVIAAGVDDRSMLGAIRTVAGLGGGLAVVRDDTVLASLALPVGGLMSPEPVETVRAGLDRVVAEARALGSPLHDPFMALSFLGLEVIPTLKLTDLGLVDVDAFRPVPLWR